MKREHVVISGIPVLIWGEPSDKVWLCIHGKQSDKESAEGIAGIAEEKGYQTVSFDLPQHGERQNETDRCDIWNGIRDLSLVAEYVFSRWQNVNLYACSLGAFFCLYAYKDFMFRKCLFQSPILDMEHLVEKMMKWFGISEKQLEREQEIDTPIDVLSWKYLQYIRGNAVENWVHPTCIPFAGKDNLQSREVVNRFATKFGCQLTVAENSQHLFMEETDIPVVEHCLRENI